MLIVPINPVHKKTDLLHEAVFQKSRTKGMKEGNSREPIKHARLKLFWRIKSEEVRKGGAGKDDLLYSSDVDGVGGKSARTEELLHPHNEIRGEVKGDTAERAIHGRNKSVTRQSISVLGCDKQKGVPG